jgi:hypothetical protein
MSEADVEIIRRVKERLLLGALGAGLALKRPRRPGRGVLVVDARPAGGGQLVAGDLPRPVRAVGVDDDELGGVDARPHALVDEPAGDGVDRTTDRDRRLPANAAGLAEADRVRHRWQRVQPLPLLGEHHRRRPARDAMLARVDALAERGALAPQLAEVQLLAAQVVVGRDEICPSDPDRRLAAALALRIGGDTGRNRQPVVTRDRDDLRIAHRDPAHVID